MLVCGIRRQSVVAESYDMFSRSIDAFTHHHHSIFDMHANHDGAPTIPPGGGGLRRRHPSLPRLNVSLWHIPEQK